ncbi:ADP-ribose pyrophosphatase [Planctomycetes bacterium Pla163]|uniref:GDP-mannose pyrophosphatase n=1 Tax=Rohdeia mirabilis TaxID=2528008 RepID=A0A518D230_9BACT|nr:ADP-ribose pyrophosphatase [Planctomycetes bacterium Pla163]
MGTLGPDCGSDSGSDAGAGAGSSADSHPDRPRVLGTRELCSTRIFSVHQERVVLPSGLEQDLAVVRHGGAVAVAAVGANGRLLVVRQYRHAVGDWLEEVVAGRLEPGEEPLAAARRELEEEAGMRAEHWREVSTFFPAPGFCSERMTLFVATGLRAAGPDRLAPDDDEEIEVAWRRPQDVLASARDAKTLVAAAFVLRDGAADSGLT